MPKRKFIRKITKKGKYSYYIIVPKDILNGLKWRERQKVVLKRYGKDKILIADWKPPRSASSTKPGTSQDKPKNK